VNSIEERIRAATRAQAEMMREVRPLSVPSAPDAASRRPRRSLRAHRWRAWLAPAAAALCVLAVGVSLALVKNTPNDGGITRPTQAAGSVPRYYAALSQQPETKDPPMENVVIGDTFTGKTLATISPPAGANFIGVSGAADDRTFVVDTAKIRGDDFTWYLLRITPGTVPGYGLTRLPMPGMSSFAVEGMSLSGSGSKLAVVLMPLHNGSVVIPGTPLALRIYSVATGRLLRTWPTGNGDFSSSGGGGIPGNWAQPSWVDNDTALAFPDASATRLLNVTAPGGSLIPDSQVVCPSVAKFPVGCVNVNDVVSTQLSSDGKTVVCATVTGTDIRTLRWLAYSVSGPGKPRVLYQVTVPGAANSTMLTILWVSPSGNTLIIDWAATPTNTITPADSHVGVIRDGKFTRLPSLPSYLEGQPMVAW
jgi:hypothetical protein